MSEAPVEVRAELQGTVISLGCDVGTAVAAGSSVGQLESMKLHHDIVAPTDGTVTEVLVAVGDTVERGRSVMRLAPTSVGSSPRAGAPAPGGPSGPDRPDLAAVLERRRIGLDAARPDAVERRRAVGRRTARENVADLVDPGSFVEYGPFATAHQEHRRDPDDLIARTPADGLIAGIGTINGGLFDGHAARAIAMSYDYTVLAGTQGFRNHLKKDRLFELAERLRLPVVFFTEGGGGRPGDAFGGRVAFLDCLAFHWFAQLSGTVPLVGINAGYCFAGNAAILGCCDVVIATRDSNVGMGGPAMIEGGGLGSFHPREIGPIDVQRSNGVVDLVADDEAHATQLAKRYLSYFQGTVGPAPPADPTAVRDLIPTDRLRSYAVRPVIDALFDTDTVLELRRDFGRGMVTALARIDGRPVGVFANDPQHLAGAIDVDGADKVARFLQLCDAHGLPIVSLVDTPGMMVGPDVERDGLVRHCSRLFVNGANLTVPIVSIVLRKAYGLGAQAMMGGSTRAPLACLAWPTAEFGAMGLEGAVRLGYRDELAACESEADRNRLFGELVDRLYEQGRALRFAEVFEIDDVIDPADTRHWLTTLLDSVPAAPVDRSRRPNIDTW